MHGRRGPANFPVTANVWEEYGLPESREESRGPGGLCPAWPGPQDGGWAVAATLLTETWSKRPLLGCDPAHTHLCQTTDTAPEPRAALPSWQPLSLSLAS